MLSTFYLCINLFFFPILDKSSSMYGQMAHSIEPNSTSDLSPVTANDDNVDEVDDDYPFSKRRY